MDDRLDIRVTALESWKTNVEVTLGKTEVKHDYINARFDKVESELKDIKNTARNLNLTIWGAVLVYGLKFALGGGLAGVL